jgi:hypothetical protein
MSLAETAVVKCNPAILHLQNHKSRELYDYCALSVCCLILSVPSATVKETTREAFSTPVALSPVNVTARSAAS